MRSLLLFSLVGIILSANHSSASPDGSKFFPIELVCPATESDGTLDLVSQNLKRDRNRMRVIYSDYKPFSVAVAVAFPGQELRPLLTIELEAHNMPIDQAYANDLAAKANALKKNVCEGTASNRQRYLAALSKNKSIFINASRNRRSN